MAFHQQLSGCKNLSPALEKKTVAIQLKHHDVRIMLDITSYEATRQFQTYIKPRTADEHLNSLSCVIQAHLGFRVSLGHALAPTHSLENLCSVEVDIIRQFFPYIDSEAILVCFSAWLAFVCDMDDTIETMAPLEGEYALRESIKILQGYQTQEQYNNEGKDTRIQQMSLRLREHCREQLSEGGYSAFAGAACVVLQAHIEEIMFLQNRIPNDISTYMAIRSRTIALNPFFEVLKSELLPQECRQDALWETLQAEVSRAAGLQNDLVGLERDLERGEQLNAILVLLRTDDGLPLVLDTHLFSQCIASVSKDHNESVARAIVAAEQLEREADIASTEAIAHMARHIVLLCQTHLQWCSTAKRYGYSECGTETSSEPVDGPSYYSMAANEGLDGAAAQQVR
ncbi:hypothetical protein GQ53DRAFT_814734 [Thozetella sp. PMI_491]|nr:hypothetical protein GQ53DRAFT_814734 [Thozetella sp. PMI_491]